MELKKNYFAKKMRAVRAKRRKEGLCIRCGKCRDSTLLSCNKCREAVNKKMKDKPKVSSHIRPRAHKIINYSLQRAIVDKGFSSETLAKAIGVSTRTVDRWLSEGYNPSRRSALLVNEALDNRVYEVEDDDL